MLGGLRSPWGAFVHGAVTAASAGRLPPAPGAAPPPPAPTPAAWARGLAAWLRARVEEWHRAPPAPPGAAPWAARGGYGAGRWGLIQYGMGTLPPPEPGGAPVPGSNFTAVTKRWVHDGQPAPPDAAASRWLTGGGVRLVVSGHQPHGDAPVIVNTPGLCVACADTSYSADTEWSGGATAAGGGGGRANTHRSPSCGHDVVVELPAGGAPPRLRVRGAVSNGARFAAYATAGDPAASLAGRETRDGWWVKGTTGDGVLLSRGEGFTVYNRIAPEAEVRAALLPCPAE